MIYKICHATNATGAPIYIESDESPANALVCLQLIYEGIYDTKKMCPGICLAHCLIAFFGCQPANASESAKPVEMSRTRLNNLHTAATVSEAEAAQIVSIMATYKAEAA